MKFARWALGLVLVGCLTTLAVAAQKRMPLSMLCQHAERIVIAEVTSSSFRYADWPGLGNVPTTVFTVTVEETWKGATAQTLEVQVLGGYDPERELVTRASGAAEMRIGQRVLLFVDEKDGIARVYGREQGRYDVKVRRVVGRPGMPIDQDILTPPLKKQILTILAAQAKESLEGGGR